MNSANQLDLAYSVGMALCGIMAVANLMRVKSRGPAAIAMGCACISLGATIWMTKSHLATVWLVVGAVLTGVLLVVEFGLRAARQGTRQ